MFSIDPLEEEDNELQLPYSFLETGSNEGCYNLHWQMYLLVIQAGDHPCKSPAPTPEFLFMEGKYKHQPCKEAGSGVTCLQAWVGTTLTILSHLSTVLITEEWEGAFSSSHWKGRKNNTKKSQKTMEGRQVVIEPIRKYFHELGKKANEDETK